MESVSGGGSRFGALSVVLSDMGFTWQVTGCHCHTLTCSHAPATPLTCSAPRSPRPSSLSSPDVHPPYIILLIRTFLTLEGIAGQVDLPPRLEHTPGRSDAQLPPPPPQHPPAPPSTGRSLVQHLRGRAAVGGATRALAVDRGGHRRPPFVGVDRRRTVPVGTRGRAHRGAEGAAAAGEGRGGGGGGEGGGRCCRRRCDEDADAGDERARY